MLKKSFLIGLLLCLTMMFVSVQIFAQKGHYKNGRGSSHKSGHYKNSSTGNHYRRRH